MLRRLHPDQPEAFAFSPANMAWAEAQMSKYPEGRQASAVIPLLWRAQEQEGWLTRPAIEHVAEMLGMAYIRVLEVASFYFMFQLQPVGSVAHIQVCGTTSCMICGAEDLIGVCREKIAPKPHQVSEDGKFSWEEVECLGACANAPMAQIGKDYFEDLTAESFAGLIDALAKGDVPQPGPQNGRFASEPQAGLSSLKEFDSGKLAMNASATLATDIGDTVKRIDGTEVPLLAPWRDRGANHAPDASAVKVKATPVAVSSKAAAKPAAKKTAEKAPAKTAAKKPAAKKADAKPAAKKTTTKKTAAKPASAAAAVKPKKPKMRKAARKAGPDDLKRISGVGPKLEGLLHNLGVFHFDQVAAWNEAEIEWVDDNLKFKGRITRDDWVGQAKAFMEEDKTGKG